MSDAGSKAAEWPAWMRRWPRLGRCLFVRAIEGLLVAGFLGFWFTSHALLHSEMERPEWRAVVLPRVLATAPFLMVMPVVAFLAAGVIRCRRGSDGDRPPLWWRGIRHVVFLASFVWTAQVLLLWWYAALLRVG